jgi:hypothetical protein
VALKLSIIDSNTPRRDPLIACQKVMVTGFARAVPTDNNKHKVKTKTIEKIFLEFMVKL